MTQILTKPKNPKTLIPIEVFLSDTDLDAQTTKIIVSNKNYPAFAFELKRTKPGMYKGEFWVEHPGTYTILYKQSTHIVDVQAQEFLSFKQEFGFFFILFVILMTWMIVWLKKNKKKWAS